MKNKDIKIHFRWEFIMTVMLLVLAISLFTGVAYAFFTLPGTDSLENLQMKAATEVYDINGRLISKLFEENRTVVSINNMSPFIANAVVANEDVRFYKHYGIDPVGILRAVWVNIVSGSFSEGGSTITQQLAKNMFLSQERTVGRKIKEAVLALIIESRFSKEEILQAYLNQVYFGEGAYGVEAASMIYFGKHAAELNLAESALLAGLPRGPGIYSPYRDIKAAMNRRETVLQGMVKAAYITEAEAEKAQRQPVVLAGQKKRAVQASYFLDYVASELAGRYGADRVYRGGLKVYTTMDTMQQQAAEKVLGKFQGAVLALDPRNGYIKAMVGGRNYEESQTNRVINEKRQPGSAFKPFVYATAINQGLTAGYVVIDEPININGYAPGNYDKKNRGTMTLKKALEHSINVAAVKVAQQVGMPNILQLAASMGITTLVPEDNNLASALGGLTQGVSLFEICGAYGVFANAGVLSKPVAILKVLDENGQLLEEAQAYQRQVLRPAVAFIVTDMLKAVIQSGTATPANIGRPAAGKTGTTDNYETAWFIGYTPSLLVGIFVGNDDRTPVGISGTEVSAMWGKMLESLNTDLPSADFPVPPDVIAGVPVCSRTGQLATPDCKEIEYDAFIRGTEPGYGADRNRQKETPPVKSPFKWNIPWL